MWCLETLDLLNGLVAEQASKGLPERDALFLMTDPRRKEELASRSQEMRNLARSRKEKEESEI